MKFGQFVVGQFDEMKMAEDDDCLGQVGRYRGAIGWRHIDCHRPDLRLGSFQAFPERCKAVSASAVTDKDNSAGDEIEHYGEIPRSLADGDRFQMLQILPGKAAREGCPQNLFDGVPAYSEVSGNIANGHTFRQFNDIA